MLHVKHNTCWCQKCTQLINLPVAVDRQQSEVQHMESILSLPVYKCELHICHFCKYGRHATTLPFIVCCINQVDLPKHPVAESVVVVDPHPGTFLRQVHSRSMQTHQQPLCSSTASGCKIDASQVSDSGHEPGARLQHLLHLLKRLQALGWIDRIVVANAKGSEKAQVRLQTVSISCAFKGL